MSAEGGGPRKQADQRSQSRSGQWSQRIAYSVVRYARKPVAGCCFGRSIAARSGEECIALRIRWLFGADMLFDWARNPQTLASYLARLAHLLERA